MNRVTTLVLSCVVTAFVGLPLRGEAIAQQSGPTLHR